MNRENHVTKLTYLALVARLEAIEAQTGVYLTDACVDRENVTVSEDAPDFWARMYDAAVDAAQFRGEENGIDVLKALDRA